jgi:hypothetical protein
LLEQTHVLIGEPIVVRSRRPRTATAAAAATTTVDDDG